MPFPSDSQRTELHDATFDSVSTTSNAPCAVPDLTGSVHKRKPIFNGTYSTVYEGELDGKKVVNFVTYFVITITEQPSGRDKSAPSGELSSCDEACKCLPISQRNA
jgi:hypothetical protein